MTEYVNSFLLLTLLGIIYYIYYKHKIFVCAINIVMDSVMLDQLNKLENDVDSEVKVIKTRRGCKKKTDTKTLLTINEEDTNDIREKRDRLVECVLSGKSKQYLGKEYTEQQINEMDSINILSNKYESVLSAQMTKSLGKSVINLYSNIACSALGIGNQQDLSNDLECDPSLSTALQRFTFDLYYRFGAFSAPISVGIISGKHHTKNYIPKLNGRSDSGNCELAETGDYNKAEEFSES